MTVQDIPEWLVEYLEDNTGFKRPGYFSYPYYTTTQQSDAVVAFYEFISKPENAARIPEVESLIGHATASCQFPHKDHCDLEAALKPFKKEGSDGI